MGSDETPPPHEAAIRRFRIVQPEDNQQVRRLFTSPLFWPKPFEVTQQMRESIESLSHWERSGEGCWRRASVTTIRKNLEVLGYGG